MICRGGHGTGEQVAVIVVGEVLFGAVWVHHFCESIYDVVAVARGLSSWVGDACHIAVTVIG